MQPCIDQCCCSCLWSLMPQVVAMPFWWATQFFTPLRGNFNIYSLPRFHGPKRDEALWNLWMLGTRPGYGACQVQAWPLECAMELQFSLGGNPICNEWCWVLCFGLYFKLQASKMAHFSVCSLCSTDLVVIISVAFWLLKLDLGINKNHVWRNQLTNLALWKKIRQQLLMIAGKNHGDHSTHTCGASNWDWLFLGPLPWWNGWLHAQIQWQTATLLVYWQRVCALQI